MNYGRVDKELAKYANAARIDISEAENKRLKRLIDKRVLPIIIFTYFLQALDKGTLSLASIMGIKTDAHLVGQQMTVLLAYDLYLHRRPHCRIPSKLAHPTRSDR